MDLPELFCWYVVFLFSVTLHEFAHSWVAQKGGDLTAYRGGQVTLNPMPHIKREPLGMVVFPVMSLLLIGWPFGYASAPYDPYWAARHPHRAAWMAFAGPASNLCLVVFSVIGIRLGILTGIFEVPDTIGYSTIAMSLSQGWESLLAFMLSILFTLNLVLTVLNLIPLPPLDGSGIISLFLKEETATKYQQVVSNPVFGFIGFMVAWRLFDPLFDAIFLVALNLIYPGSGFS